MYRRKSKIYIDAGNACASSIVIPKSIRAILHKNLYLCATLKKSINEFEK
ncbi:hypothetical protein AsAng_0058100 [Aureispira anguillae]|uniref:Uncharacterized protein n=1 Tax=Aureispira anguillae TaxID=2864201 RepID=A0A915YKS6_9BACT|nr:hypothetical protein AsAng_0058100 [Aureispira anguillae]